MYAERKYPQLFLEDDTCRYQLVARPCKEAIVQLNEELEGWKQNFPIPFLVKEQQIIFAQFTAKERMEPTLLRWLQNVCTLHAAFRVSLNNYSSNGYDNVYLRVQETQHFERLGNALRIIDGFIQTNGCPPLQVLHPALVLACNIPAYLLEKALPEISQRCFHISFPVDKILLVKTSSAEKASVITSFFLPAIES